MRSKNGGRKLIVFIRIPEEGRVKSRLASGAGAGNAVKLYRAMLEDLGGNIEPYKNVLVPMVDRPTDPRNRDEKLPKPWTCGVRLQEGQNLGERMENAFRDVFWDGSRTGAAVADKAVLIGSDVPHIRHETVADAFELLDRKDMVLGPAVDGGYYLIGFRADAFFRIRSAPGGLFRTIPWGTAEVFSVTVDRALGLGLSVGEVSVMVDIDTLEDLIRVLKSPEAEGLPRLRAKALELGVISFRNG
jgi:hypothetical protein